MSDYDTPANVARQESGRLYRNHLGQIAQYLPRWNPAIPGEGNDATPWLIGKFDGASFVEVCRSAHLPNGFALLTPALHTTPDTARHTNTIDPRPWVVAPSRAERAAQLQQASPFDLQRVLDMTRSIGTIIDGLIDATPTYAVECICDPTEPAELCCAHGRSPDSWAEELDQATQRAEAAEADAAALRHQLAEVDAHIERLAARLGYPAPADEDTPA